MQSTVLKLLLIILILYGIIINKIYKNCYYSVSNYSSENSRNWVKLFSLSTSHAWNTWQRAIYQREHIPQTHTWVILKPKPASLRCSSLMPNTRNPSTYLEYLLWVVYIPSRIVTEESHTHTHTNLPMSTIVSSQTPLKSTHPFGKAFLFKPINIRLSLFLLCVIRLCKSSTVEHQPALNC